MNKKVVIALLVIMLAFSAVVSASDYLPHKQNTNFEFAINSNNATECNVTSVTTPTKLDNVGELMVKNGQSFEIVLSGQFFGEFGTHCVNIVCFDGETYESGSVCREVTAQGYENDNSFLATILMILGVLALSIVLYIRKFKFVGAMFVFVTGFGVLFSLITYGWLGWIIIAIGVTMLVDALVSSPDKKNRF
jgi:hypothetical protein